MTLLDSLGIAACVLMVFAELMWIGLACEQRDREAARRAARRRP